MATTRNEIRDWFEYGQSKGQYTHMVVVCDTFDYEDFPVYFTGTADEAKEFRLREDTKPMQKVMEVYNLNLPVEPQLAQFRAWNY